MKIMNYITNEMARGLPFNTQTTMEFVLLRSNQKRWLVWTHRLTW